MVTSVENADSQTYIVANGIKASTALFTRRGYASLKEHQNSPKLFQLISSCSKFFILRAMSSSLDRPTSSREFTSERKGLRIHG
jgi:hypothetical protein